MVYKKPEQKTKAETKRISREIPITGDKVQLQSSMDGGKTWENVGEPYPRWKPGKDLTGEAAGRLTESERKIISKNLKAKGGIVKRYKGGLMVKPKAAKRGY